MDAKRCSRLKPPHTSGAVLTTVLIHFCAKAVVHSGIHPETRSTYNDWDNPEKTFGTERHPHKFKYDFLVDLVRQQEFFTQIFTWLYLAPGGDPGITNAFERLSQGWAGLYSLNYDIPLHQSFIEHEWLRRNWREEIASNFEAAKAKAARLLAIYTRGSPLEKWDMVLFSYQLDS